MVGLPLLGLNGFPSKALATFSSILLSQVATTLLRDASKGPRPFDSYFYDSSDVNDRDANETTFIQWEKDARLRVESLGRGKSLKNKETRK